MQETQLNRSIKILFFLILVVVALYYAKSFLVPVAFAGILAMLLLPVSKWLEQKGWARGWSVVVAVLTLIAIAALIIILLTWQLNDLTEDLTNVEAQLKKMLANVQMYIKEHFGISPSQQQKIIDQQQTPGSGGGVSIATNVLAFMGGLVADIILTLVYIFLFLYYRAHLKKFILRVVPGNNNRKTTKVIEQSCNVAQQYLGGLALMIGCLWILYGIAFSIVGVKNALFFAVLCGILEIVPFVGNLVGSTLAVLMVIVQGGGTPMVLGVIISYATIQFIQTYILEPLVVGAEVNINPLFTIMALVVGELIWGLPGMVLAIPLLGILKIVFENVEDLHPYAFLIGDKKKRGDSTWVQKIKQRFFAGKQAA